MIIIMPVLQVTHLSTTNNTTFTFTANAFKQRKTNGLSNKNNECFITDVVFCTKCKRNE